MDAKGPDILDGLGQSDIETAGASDTQDARADLAERAEKEEKAGNQVEWSVSAGLTGFLAQNSISFGFTSYQSGRLYLVGRDPKGGIHINERQFPHAMGLTGDRDSLWLVTQHQIYRFANPLRPGEIGNGTYDTIYTPREVLVTGALDGHDIGLDVKGRPIFVNTRWNCLAAPSETHSFKPLWKPPFISTLIDEDRCHLNGLAMAEGGEAGYVTAVSRSDTIDGWRDRRDKGGVLIDVKADKVLLSNLSMPHSPRLHQDKVWLLNSGTGDLGFVDPASKKPKFEPVTFCPGFARGLSFHGDYAFVGLSKPRYKRFEGLALDNRLAEKDTDPWCGVQVIDIRNGKVVEWIRLDGTVAELYDVAVLPDVTTAMALTLNSGELITLITVEDHQL